MGDRHAAETGRGWEQCRERALGNGQVGDDGGDCDGDNNYGGDDGDDGDRNVAMLVIVESRVLTFDSCETVDV